MVHSTSTTDLDVGISDAAVERYVEVLYQSGALIIKNSTMGQSLAWQESVYLFSLQTYILWFFHVLRQRKNGPELLIKYLSEELAANKSLVSSLLLLFGFGEVERSLLSSQITSLVLPTNYRIITDYFQLHEIPNTLLMTLKTDNSPQPLINTLKSLPPEAFDDYVLGSFFERTLTHQTKKKSGAYYTPRRIAQAIVSKSIELWILHQLSLSLESSWTTFEELCEQGTSEELVQTQELLRNMKVLDPAVGSGHFLSSVMSCTKHHSSLVCRKAKERGIQLSPPSSPNGGDDISPHVWGVDVNEKAVRVTQARLHLMVLQRVEDSGGEINNLAELTKTVQLSCANSLLEQPFERLKKIKSTGYDQHKFDIVVGNPPYGGTLDPLEKRQYQSYNLSKANLAKLFIIRGYELTQEGGCFSFLVPKSLTYASDWVSLRKLLFKELHMLSDVKEAFHGVLLEQVYFVVVKNDPQMKYLASDFSSNTQPIFVPKRMLSDTFYCDVTEAELRILQSLVDNPSTSEFVRTFRGLGLQKYRTRGGDRKVIGGKNIGRYVPKRDLDTVEEAEVPEELSRSFPRYTRPKVVFQNIVAYVKRPTPHIKLMGTLDKEGLLCFDTINVLDLRDKKVSNLLILGIMNSLIYSWLFHLKAMNRAVRTMHLDNYSLSKVPFPSLKDHDEVVESIEGFVKTLLKHFDLKTYLALEEEVLKCYGLVKDELPPSYVQLVDHYHMNGGKI